MYQGQDEIEISKVHEKERKYDNTLENVKNKYRMLRREKGKWTREGGREGERGAPPAQQVIQLSGEQGPSSPCPLFIKARGEWRHSVLFMCFFIIFFSVCRLNQSLCVTRWQCPLPSFYLACSLDLSLFFRPHMLGSFHLFSEMITFRPVKWKAMTWHITSEPFQMDLLERFILILERDLLD